MEILIKAGQFILSLSILIVLHELGHMVPAKLFKIRVEKFYLFFNPWFSLFKIKRGETEYGIGWLPLGGYVKISGMIDESMDKEQMAQPPQPHEFRSKPAWQRLIIMLGGVTVNIILAMLIYALVMFTWGDKMLLLKDVSHGVYPSELCQELGFESGDQLVAVDGRDFDEDYTVRHVNRDIVMGNVVSLQVQHNNGQKETIKFPEHFNERVLDSGQVQSFSELIPFVVDSVQSPFRHPAFAQYRPAKIAGLRKGDTIVGVNNVSTPFFQDFGSAVSEHKGKWANIKVKGSTGPRECKVYVTGNGVIGVRAVGELKKHFNITHVHYGFFEAFPAGVGRAIDQLNDYIEQFKLFKTKAGLKQIGGFGSIGSMYAPKWDWESFWLLTAMLSVVLAFMNVLPIPALDGGHALFLLYEIITGKTPSNKFLERAQVVGFVLLVTLLLYANGNDLFKFITGK